MTDNEVMWAGLQLAKTEIEGVIEALTFRYELNGGDPEVTTAGIEFFERQLPILNNFIEEAHRRVLRERS